MARKKTANGRTAEASTKKAAPAGAGTTRVYTLEVFLIGGPITSKFAKKNPVVSRAIALRGDQTLEDLHHALFDAFGREEEHMYEFQLGGKAPMDPEAARYVPPSSFEHPVSGPTPAGRVDQTTLDSLGLKEGDCFAYWFDFGDDWWHRVNVEAIEDKVPRGKFPKVTKKVGKSPPQYADLDEDDE